MKRYMDFLQRVTSCELIKNRKIVIWGAGIYGKNLGQLLRLNGIEVSYYVDERYDEKKRVFSPEKLMKDSDGNLFIIVSPLHIPYILAIDSRLEEMGFKKDIDFTNFSDDKELSDYTPYHYDLLLGYAKKKDFDGFRVFGNEKSKKSIAILGNCTSVDKDLFWPDVFRDRLNESWGDDWCIYNGSCEGYASGQEMLKTIRDVATIKPRVLVILNGVIDAIMSNTLEYHPYVSKFANGLVSGIMGESGEEYKGLQHVPAELLIGCEQHEAIWETYARNMSIINTVCQSTNTELMVFFQPSLYHIWDSVLSDEQRTLFELVHKDDGGQLAKAHEFYKKTLNMLSGREPWFYDLTNVFTEYMSDNMVCFEDFYMDEIHYTKLGNRIIGEKIADNLLHKNKEIC